jgi:superfamily II DNA or RNA helicase
VADLLRPYQLDAVQAATEALEKSRSVLLVLATGLGKTVIFCAIAKQFVPRGPVLVLAHREELIAQAARQFKRWTGMEAGIEKAEATCAGHKDRPPVVIASVQSLSRPARLEAYQREAFSLVIVDECHHATSASYRLILDHFAPAKVLGVTATPDRHDRQALGQVFEAAPFAFDLEDGIRGGWLAPVRQMRVVVESLDFSRVRTNAGDLNEADLEQILLEERHLHAVATPTLEHAGQRKTLIFATSVQHAHQLAAVLNRLKEH